jgi:ribosomal protein S20
MLAVLATVFVASLYGFGMYALTRTGNAGARVLHEFDAVQRADHHRARPTLSDQMDALKAGVNGDAPKSALSKTVKKIEGYVAANDIANACNELKAFIKQVNALAAKKKLSAAQAASLIALANNIKSTLGC